MNRNTVQLILAVLAGWLIGGMAATPLVPVRMYVLMFVLAIMVPSAIVLWPHRDPTGQHYQWAAAMTGSPNRQIHPALVALVTFAGFAVLFGWRFALVAAPVCALLSVIAWRPLKRPMVSIQNW